MRAADTAVLAAYFVTMVVVGMVYSRRMKSLDRYFAGGKQLSWWLGGVSFVMAYVSALSIVVYAALGYQYGLVALTIYWTTVPGTLITTWLLARRWRRAGIITPVEFLETRFSSAVRQIFVWSGIPLKIIDDGLKIVAIGIFVSAGMKISADGAMLAVGLIALIYTVMGGLWAVAVTDFVQFVLVMAGIILMVPLSLHAAGGWRHFVAVAPEGFLHPVHGPYTWSYIGAFLVLSAMSLAGNWSLIQKFYSARSDRECRGVGWLASFLFLIMPPLWIFTGMSARAFVSLQGFDPQRIYAHVSASLMPPGMLGLVVAALFASTMSVLSSGYNVSAAVLTVDVYQRLVHPKATQRELVVMGRILTALVALIALAIALTITHFHWTIFNAMVAAFGFFLPPTVLPVLAGLLTPRLSSGGAIAGFITGIAAGLALIAYKLIAKPANLASYQAASIVIPTVATLIALFLGAYVFPVKGEARERSSRFFTQLSRPARTSETNENPASVAGVVISIMGLVLMIVGLGFMATRANTLTFGTGFVLVLVGVAMMKPRWFEQMLRRPQRVLK
jgi:SSS family solute:Na+ symporter